MACTQDLDFEVAAQRAWKEGYGEGYAEARRKLLAEYDRLRKENQTLAQHLILAQRRGDEAERQTKPALIL